MLKALRAWCDAHDVLLIFDEVLTAFGRTGRLFACEHESVLPDFLCLAKGLTGGCLPLAATLTTERVYDAFLGEYHELKTFFYGHSYCGNPLGCAAALASLKIFQEEDTLETLREKISLLRELLDGLRASPQRQRHSPMWLHRRNRNPERFRQTLSMAESNGRPGVRRRAQARLAHSANPGHDCPHAAFVHDAGAT